MSFPCVDNQAHQTVNNERVRSSILEIASTTGALCALANDPSFSSDNTAFPVNVPEGISTSLLNISVKVIEELLNICEELDLVLSRCIFEKILINNCKYPEKLCKGSMDKYTTYHAETGVTKENQSISLNAVSASLDFDEGKKNSDFCNLVLSVTASLVEFVRVRDWTKFDTPRNLMLAMLGEVGELAEVMLWKGDLREYDTFKNGIVVNKLSQEISDVAIYLLRVVWVCKLTEKLRQRLTNKFKK